MKFHITKENKRLVIYAIRYCITRKSYAVLDAIDYFKTYKDLFEINDLKHLLEDVRYYIFINTTEESYLKELENLILKEVKKLCQN